MIEQRIFINSSILDLESETGESWDDPQRLAVVLHELDHRKSKRSKKLKKRIKDRLDNPDGNDSYGGCQAVNERGWLGRHQVLVGEFHCECGMGIFAARPRGTVIAECLRCGRKHGVFIDQSGDPVVEAVDVPGKRYSPVEDEIPFYCYCRCGRLIKFPVHSADDVRFCNTCNLAFLLLSDDEGNQAMVYEAVQKEQT